MITNNSYFLTFTPFEPRQQWKEVGHFPFVDIVHVKILQFFTLNDLLRYQLVCKKSYQVTSQIFQIIIKQKEIQQDAIQPNVNETLVFLKINMVKISKGSTIGESLRGELWFDKDGRLIILAGIESQSIINNNLSAKSIKRLKSCENLPAFKVKQILGKCDLMIEIRYSDGYGKECDNPVYFEKHNSSIFSIQKRLTIMLIEHQFKITKGLFLDRFNTQGMMMLMANFQKQ